MDTNVANFGNYKKMFDSQVIYVGDLVEWQDYDGQNYEGLVTGIEYQALNGFRFANSAESLPLWEKDEYVVLLENGLSLAGSAIVRKVVRKAGQRKTQALSRFCNAN